MMLKPKNEFSITEGTQYIRGSRTNVKPVNVVQHGKPVPKPIRSIKPTVNQEHGR